MDLTGLHADAEYEVRIRAMNHQGWSQLSDPFFFKTSGSVTSNNLFDGFVFTIHISMPSTQTHICKEGI